MIRLGDPKKQNRPPGGKLGQLLLRSLQMGVNDSTVSKRDNFRYARQALSVDTNNIPAKLSIIITAAG